MAGPRADRRAITTQIIDRAATAAHRDVLNAGREVIRASSTRWRRVTDGSPCGFCAMIASRGPVYSSADTAGMGGNRYHSRCGCSVEPFEGDPKTWAPTPDEQRYIDAYNASWRSGDDAAAIAKRMEEWLANPANADDVAASLADPAKWVDLDDDTLDALAMQAMDEGDFLAAERIGEIMDGRFYDPTGRRIDATDPFRSDVFDWYAKQDPATQARFAEKLESSLGYDAGQAFAQESWAHVNTAKLGRTLPTERQIRRDYDDWLESEWLKAEAATNGYMLSPAAKAQGVTVRKLWKVNATTAKKWATPEMLDYWDTNGRLTLADFRAGFTGKAETTANLMKGRWA